MENQQNLKVKRYRVDDFQAGLKQIKQEVGDNAIIVNTSRITDPSEKGNFEITVSVDPETMTDSDPEKTSTNGYGGLLDGDSNAAAASHNANNGHNGYSNHNGDSNNELASMVEDLAENVKSLKSDLRDVRDNQNRPGSQSGKLPAQAPNAMLQAFRTSLSKLQTKEKSTTFCQTISKIFESLKSRGVSEDHIEQLLAKALEESDNWEDNPTTLYDNIEDEIANQVRTLPPLWQTRCSGTEIAIFAGPTGVGKTTTVAKTAAYSKFVGHKNVAIICADTFRIGGLYQLETYADLVGVPTKSVSTFREFKGALNTFRDMDLILVDTRGQSPWTESPEEDIDLRAYQSLGSADFEIKYSLCLSTTNATQNLIDLAQSYRDIRPMSLVFTKVDESRQIGSMLSVSMETELPISHVCHGPQVPDDIMSPTDGEVARWIQHGLSSSDSTLESQIGESMPKMGA